MGTLLRFCGDECGETQLRRGNERSRILLPKTLSIAPARQASAPKGQEIAKTPPKSFNLMLSLNEYAGRIEKTAATTTALERNVPF
jgi:hypothetical protein